jgi:hypothetical protein
MVFENFLHSWYEEAGLHFRLMHKLQSQSLNLMFPHTILKQRKFKNNLLNEQSLPEVIGPAERIQGFACRAK